MAGHSKSILAAILLAFCAFVTARADRITTDQLNRINSKLAELQPLHLGGADLRSLSLGAKDSALSSAAKSGALTTDRLREDHDRMRLPAFVVSIPEPLTLALMATGLLGLGAALRKRL